MPAEGRERNLVRLANRMSVEGDAQTVWLGQRDPRLLSGVGEAGRVRGVVAPRAGRIR